MERKSNPCRKDCPNRTATCHGSCPAYKAYRKKRDEYLAEQHDQRAVYEAWAERGDKIRRDVRKRGLSLTRRRK